ncbi:MAG TPA: alpha-amylase family glycosyl hydrolase [Terriglobales bacterium]|nr:alpha-amylase family glycosyl hydrolase [Terriglobales bacterium]
MVEKRLADLDWKPLLGRSFHPSPLAWEDQMLYFLLPDRFSDGKERDYQDIAGNAVTSGTTPLFNRNKDFENAIQTATEAQKWRDAGGVWVGGTLQGLTSKLGYLRHMGVTALWVGPIFKQVAFQATYHGYGVQNFLDVDPHFGTREDLKTLVKTAHDNGIYVILDIILNHSGDVFSYANGNPTWTGAVYPVQGFNDAKGNPTLPFQALDQFPSAWPDGAAWPAEFQNSGIFTRKGAIQNWDNDPEYLEGDFFDLKDIDLGLGDPDSFSPTAGLDALCEVYKFWMAFADLDGYRVDTVKHMGDGPTRYFASVMHEFAQSIGKENFLLVGEVTGGRVKAFNTVESTGIDAALGIDDVQDKLEYLIKGYRNPIDYFDLFRNSLQVQKDSHVWFRNKVVTMIDDHDQIRKGNNKARFCANDQGEKLILSAIALNLCTLGIACVYYGSEQAFDGAGGNDRYIREAMFGAGFGAFRSRNRHFFDEKNPIYIELAKIVKIREREITLRRGRQYLRQISGDGVNFGFPFILGSRMRSVVAWSRLFVDQEILLATNTDPDQPSSALVTIDNDLHRAGDTLTCLYSTDSRDIGGTVRVGPRNGKAVQLTVPDGGFVIYK